eukprot:scaffold1017_cov95-Skeletonema_dohrnii-CCMP3373.AAC.2
MTKKWKESVGRSRRTKQQHERVLVACSCGRRIIMADNADDDVVGDVFVYTGGQAPEHVTRVRIDKSVDVIEENAFRYCEHLVHVETHDGITRVGKWAFFWCKSLRQINLKSAVEIGELAFHKCISLECAEFGDKLETIETGAFDGCCSLEHLNLPSIINIGIQSFWKCKALLDIDFSERLETIERRAFWGCDRLERIAIPLKRDLFEIDVDIFDMYTQFHGCDQLVKLDLAGGIHTTVASLHMESWRSEMEEEISRINQVLPDADRGDKTGVIRQWMDAVLDKMDHYKNEHHKYVKEATTLLELALWKAKLDEKEDSSAEGRAKKAKIDVESARKEKRVTCGADIVIKNVLPFLQLK